MVNTLEFELCIVLIETAGSGTNSSAERNLCGGLGEVVSLILEAESLLVSTVPGFSSSFTF